MKTPTPPVRQWLDRIQRRFVRSRPGSVLILVVALLVLMALIGIAYMTMAQFDRAAAVQHQFNTEVDLLVDGVTNQVKAVVTSDVFVNGSFRPGTTQYNVPGGYGYYNATGLALGTSTQNGINASPQYAANPGDAWLASRVPDMLGNLQSPPNATTTPVWPFVSAPINGSALFDTPYWPNPAVPVRYARPNNVYNSPFAPGAVVIPGQTSLYPSFNNVPGFGNVLAADADGDGITDSGLVRLLVLDGITYYAAVRIVDNAAAINANIACMPNPLTTVTGSLSTPATAGIPGDFSPVNLDLVDMLNTPSTELNNLLSYRFNGHTPGLAIDDFTGLPRNDFAWMGTYLWPQGNPYSYVYFDQQWAQLGRRLQNPGNVAQGSPTVPANLFQAMPITESMTMARNFVLRDPSVVSAATSSSILEQALPQTAFNLADSAPYAPNNVGPSTSAGYWFSDNFNYAPTTETNGGMPMRALLVARNPVSNFCPGVFADRGLYAGAGYNFGDMVTYNNHRFVCINPAGSGTPPLMTTANADLHFSDRNWAFEPWTTAPTKTSVNTATFQQLYAAYWAVMCTTPNVAPFPNAAQPNRQSMFRSPLRSETSPIPSATPPLTTLQVLYLRAAIAAVNTMDLRDSDDDVTSRTIQIPGTTPTLFATIYGIEKQPYITQVYAQNNTDPTKDWAAIELYNPYPTPITMNNWQVAAAKRGAGTVALSNIQAIPTTTIPANSYVVLIDSATRPMSVTLAGTPTTVTISGLAQKGLGNEVVIMRPRLASGNLIQNTTTANNLFNETTATGANPPYDLAPVDSYDFSNMPATAPPAAPPTNSAEEWQYARPSGAAKSWHCVYPGPWNAPGVAGAGANAAPTLSATKTTSPPAMTTVLTFGVGQTAFLKGGYVDVPLQLNNTDFGGPNKSTTGTPNKNVFPYGTFARNGDILQVPFIGSYMLFTGSPTSPSIVELNAVTMDSILATAYDQNDGAKVGQPIATAAVTAENIGRFAPIDTTDSAGVANDFAPPTLPAVNPTTNPLWRYQWAMRLFDFLTVQSPQDDYSPNVDPALADLGYPTTYRYPAAGTTAPVPTPTPNVTSLTFNAWNTNTGTPVFNAGNATEETAPVDGLVNINTAPWRVLATVPWLPASNAAYSTTNVTIAKAIAFYRDVNDGSGTTPYHGHGPFKSLFELNEVLVGGAKLRDIQGATSTADYTQAQGNLSPLQGTLDGVIGDFESRFNLVTRISNLVTTRSDSYTAYILVQGWLNAQTANPTLVVQRRAAIIIDRSTVTPASPTPTTVNIPLN